MDEPQITINGTPLSIGQAMAVRVAVSEFFAELTDPDALGNDEHGRAMTAGYSARLREVVALMAARPIPERP